MILEDQYSRLKMFHPVSFLNSWQEFKVSHIYVVRIFWFGGVLLQERRLKEEAAAQQDTNNSNSFVSLVSSTFVSIQLEAHCLLNLLLVENVVDVFWQMIFGMRIYIRLHFD